MKGKIIGENQGDYFISGADGKRYQFANWDWSGKKPPKVGDMVDFVCEGDTVKSIFPILTEGQSQQSKVTLAVVCFFLGGLGIHRFMVGKVGTGIALLLINIISMITIPFTFGFGLLGIFLIVIPWVLIDFIVILTGNFKDKDGCKITS
ncbi:TM2 domain-containing protein [Bartonella krasnovii]|uniref:TM2 domain-containing protein n=1 Tax=Bartonella krasnovii TaxID=2267275 RepID=UPI001F4CFFBE|nr:TM2 domain-containing protein [Bartonella krasnovii]UNF52537.1 TM2 domain-containing protein [Bartonella krasnovii]